MNVLDYLFECIFFFMLFGWFVVVYFYELEYKGVRFLKYFGQNLVLF